MKELPIFKPEASGDQHPKYHNHDPSEKIKGDGSFYYHKLI